MSNLPSIEVIQNLPDVDNATLPAVYKNAQKALAQCSRLDECKGWSDKAAAMASYAKQSKDERLEKMAKRIRVRAVRRCGELLKAIPKTKGGAGTHESNSNSQRRVETRTQTGGDAGLNHNQVHDAVKVAEIPETEFNAKIDSDNPPTVSNLIRPKNVDECTENKKVQREATVIRNSNTDYPMHWFGTLAMLDRECEKLNPITAAKNIEYSRQEAINTIERIQHFFDIFICNLEN